MAGTTDTEQRVEFAAELEAVNGITLARLPEAASARLPSRGQVAVRATVGGHDVQTVVEPDGRRGHWVRVDQALGAAAGLGPGDHVEVVMEVARTWPEPEVPGDLAAALDGAPVTIQEMWQDITPMARWEWVRWVGATRNPDTRARRVEVTISKMEHGKRRPCCFDLAACTDPKVSRSGKLLPG